MLWCCAHNLNKPATAYLVVRRGALQPQQHVACCAAACASSKAALSLPLADLLLQLELLAHIRLWDLFLLDSQRCVAHLHWQAVVQVKQAHLMHKMQNKETKAVAWVWSKQQHKQHTTGKP